MVRLGQRLKEERLLKNVTIEEVAKATKIRPRFITAIEQGRYRVLPSKAYAQGFVKNYIAFLGLPMRESMAMFRREFDEREYVDVLPDSFVHQKRIPLHRINWYRTVIGIGVLFLLFVGYLFFQFRAAFLPPFLTVTSPKEGAALSSDFLVTGTTDTNVLVTVNNQSTYVDNNGHFSKGVSLFAGNDTITVVAMNKFGKKTVVERHVVIK